MNKPIQEMFGEAMLDAIKEFAKKDIDSAAQIEANVLNHIANNALRARLSKTLYGARWIYKLGLALLVRDDEQLAHVRLQIIDYGAVCEGILSDLIVERIRGNKMTGSKWQYFDLARYPQKRIDWVGRSIDNTIEQCTFAWYIAVAKDERIISDVLASNITKLREERNSIHIRQRTYDAYLGVSMKSYNVLLDAINETKQWKAKNP